MLAQRLQLLDFPLFSVLDYDFGLEKLRFVCHRNYLNKGERVDNVVVDLGGVERNTPARLFCFLAYPGRRSVPLNLHSESVVDEDGGVFENEDVVEADPSTTIFVLVQYYTVRSWSHPVMQKPHCRLSDAGVVDNYHLISMASVKGHAHLVPDFDDQTGKHYFWDSIDSDLLTNNVETDDNVMV